ncbi:hypothetical protein GOP47_0030362 [Adiantum capillus-veneris]|nr:hypothetical protein GOP47_0030362 [Adiantum capillus-veneris]
MNKPCNLENVACQMTRVYTCIHLLARCQERRFVCKGSFLSLDRADNRRSAPRGRRMGLASKMKSSSSGSEAYGGAGSTQGQLYAQPPPSAPPLQPQQYAQQPASPAYPAQPYPAYPQDPSYTQAKYSDPSYPQANYADPSFPQANYADPSYPQANYADPSFPQANYADPSYPQAKYHAFSAAPPPSTHVHAGAETLQSLAPTGYPYPSQHPPRPESHETQFNVQPPPGSPYQQPRPDAQFAKYSPSSSVRDLLAKKLQCIIQSNGLQRFFDPAKFQIVLQKVSAIDFCKIAAQWKIGIELAYDLAPLALYDIVFYCDDSGSMAFEENGDRINDLKFILSKVSGIATLFDDDGIMVRFMNSNVNGDGVRNAADVEQLMAQVRFSGATPLGTNLDRKVIQPFVLGQAMSNTSGMAKPVLAIVITDGEPYGESRDTIVQVIRRAKDTLARSAYGSGALAIQIAQVGKDAKTQKFLEALDKDPVVGGMIDCTSYYEMEEEEFARKGVTLTPELWLLKMCVGAIDPEYDSKDD